VKLAFKLPFLFFFPAAVVGSCSPISPTYSDKEVSPEHLSHQDFHNPRRLTAESEQALSRLGLETLYRTDPAEAISRVHQHLRQTSSAPLSLTLCEMLLDQSGRTSDWNHRLGYILEANQVARQQLGSESDGLFERIFNETCAEIFTELKDHTDWDSTVQLSGIGNRRLSLRTNVPGKHLADPTGWDELFLADDPRFTRNRRLTTLVSEGIGAPLVAHLTKESAIKRGYDFVSPVGISTPMTAVVLPGTGATEYELAFVDPESRGTVEFQGKSYPLKVNYTAPIALLGTMKPHTALGLRGFLRPEQFMDRMGLFHVSRHDPEKIPLVLVHGLMSCPAVWMQTVNALRADPVIRQHYQIVLFFYPNGLPILLNAAGLREHLEDYVEHFDPDRSRDNFRRMVLVGHSMGSILNNAQVRDSDGIIEEFIFKRRVEDLDHLSDDERDHIETLVSYEANPDVKRAIFFAAPHRGSPFALNPIGRLGNALIAFPFDLLLPGHSLEGEFEPQAHDLIHSRPNSVGSLAPNSPVLDLILSTPPHKDVALHSIIGRLNLSGPIEQSSDGIVPYTSSHLNAVESEFVVQAGHTATVSNPEAIAELIRVLKKHLKQ